MHTYLEESTINLNEIYFRVTMPEGTSKGWRKICEERGICNSSVSQVVGRDPPGGPDLIFGGS